MKALLIGQGEPAEILLSQILVHGLIQRGYTVDHLLPQPSPETCGLLKGIDQEFYSADQSGLNPSYALVVNLNADPQMARLASRLAHIKGFGYLYDGASGRVLVTGKALRYKELQHTSEKYPVFHRADLYDNLLTEIEPLKESFKPPARAANLPLEILISVGREFENFGNLLRGGLLALPRPGVHVSHLQGTNIHSAAGSIQGCDLVITDCAEVAILASQMDVPVFDLYSNAWELNELGPYSEGSAALGPLKEAEEDSQLIARITKLIRVRFFSERTDWETANAPLIRRIPEGPRLLWPDIENLTETQLWDFLLHFSSWVLHFRKPQQSLASLLTRFAAGLLGEKIHVQDRFLFHSQFQNIAIVQEKLEELLRRSGQSVKESSLSQALQSTPLPRAYAIGWLGLKDDCRSQRPSVGLMYQIRLFLTHLKLQRQLLSHCLGIFEGDSEQVYSD